MKLTASLILRNELGRYLGLCIDSLLEYVNEIRILDDGSTDGWYETLRPGWGKKASKVHVERHTARVSNEPDFHRHAAARNRLLQFTLEGEPTWVLAVDADEFVSDGQALRQICDAEAAGATSVLSLEIAEVWEVCEETLCIRQDGGWKAHQIGCVWKADAFKARAALGLKDHGHATGRVPDVIHRVPSIPARGEKLLHFGWSNVPERAERFKRYDLGDGGRFHAAAHIASIMWGNDRVKLEPTVWPESWPDPMRAQLLAKASS